MALSKNTYIAILCLAFLYSVLMSYLNLLDEPTTFEETVLTHIASLPSLTFCQRQWSHDDFEKMEDIMDAIQSTKENHYVARFSLFGKGVDFKSFDLKNSTELSVELNTTFDEVWSHGAHMQYDWPNCLVICTTLNLPFLKSPPNQGLYQVRFFSLC